MTDIDMIDYETLDYTDDRRVQMQDDGTVLVTGGIPYVDNDRIVSYDPGSDAFVARGRCSTDRDVLWNPASGLMAFASAEEAVCHIIGAPSELENLGGEYRMFLLMNEDGTPYADSGCAPDALLVQQRPGPLDAAWCAFENNTVDPTRFYGPTPEDAADAFFGID